MFDKANFVKRNIEIWLDKVLFKRFFFLKSRSLKGKFCQVWKSWMDV